MPHLVHFCFFLEALEFYCTLYFKVKNIDQKVEYRG